MPNISGKHDVVLWKLLASPWWNQEVEQVRATRHGSNWSSDSRATFDTQQLDWHLLGGWPTPLKNMSSSVGMIIPKIWKNKTCSKPPTRHGLVFQGTPAVCAQFFAQATEGPWCGSHRYPALRKPEPLPWRCLKNNLCSKKGNGKHQSVYHIILLIDWLPAFFSAQQCQQLLLLWIIIIIISSSSSYCYYYYYIYLYYTLW